MAYIYIKVNRYQICDMILENTLNQNQQNIGFLKLCDIEWLVFPTREEHFERFMNVSISTFDFSFCYLP